MNFQKGKGRMVSNIILRTISIAVLAPLVILVLYLGGIYFQCFALLCLYLMLDEWFSMNKKSKKPLVIMFSLGTLIFFGLKLSSYSIPYQYEDIFKQICFLFLPALVFTSIFAMAGWKRTIKFILGGIGIFALYVIISNFVDIQPYLKNHPEALPVLIRLVSQFGILALLIILSCVFILHFKNREKLMFPTGVLYIAIPMLFWIYEASFDKSFSLNIATAFTVVWSCDIFAYLGGRLIGGPRLAPSISPKKTWSGAIVGAVVTLAICGIFLFVQSHELRSLFLLLPVFVMIIVSILGDLLESKAKRILEIKDSGNIIPGHGGVCDRLDSFLMVSYVFIGMKALGLINGMLYDIFHIEKFIGQ